MIVGIVSCAVHDGRHSVQQEEQWLSQFDGTIKYIKNRQVKFGNKMEIVFLCEVPDDFNELAINEAASIDGWCFKLVDNTLKRLK